MHPLLQALFSPWEWRFEILVILLVLGTLYVVGWRRLRSRRGAASRLATRLRLAAYLAGLVVLAVSLMSPIDTLGGQLFFMHMVQHMLTMMIAAPLLLLANPFPMILWGLPPGLRSGVGGLFSRRSPLRTLLAPVTSAGVAWLIFLTIYLGWHEPAFYNLALQRDAVHDIQHITFFAASLLFWWQVIPVGPRLHGKLPAWGRMAFLLITIPPNMATGVMIAFSDQVIYTYYESVPRIWGYTALQDQMLGGAIMWIPGSMMFLVGALIIMAGLLKGEDGVAPRPVEGWDAPAAMAAPGVDTGGNVHVGDVHVDERRLDGLRSVGKAAVHSPDGSA